jgi:hypothetical protein
LWYNFFIVKTNFKKVVRDGKDKLQFLIVISGIAVFLGGGYG